jgi:hypothetical protein
MAWWKGEKTLTEAAEMLLPNCRCLSPVELATKLLDKHMPKALPCSEATARELRDAGWGWPPVQINSDELLDIKPPTVTQNDMGFGIKGLKRMAPFKLDFKSLDRTDEFLSSLYKPGPEKENFVIKFPDGSNWKFGGFVTAVKPGSEGLSVTVQPSGQFKVEGRMFPKGGKHMPAKPAANMQTFYVGSNATPADWTHADLKTAVAHATELVNDRDGAQEEVFIVKVVKVVKRKEAPVTVTNFKAPRVAKTRG